MSIHYDHFTAQLRCPVCGTLSPADDSTEMYTYIRDEPSGAWLVVGDTLVIDRQALAEGRSDGYHTLAVPAAGEAVHLLNSWRCGHCGAFNWARISVDADTITAIEPVALGRQAMADAHLMARDASFIAEDLRGVGPAVLTPDEVIATLREQLP